MGASVQTKGSWFESIKAIDPPPRHHLVTARVVPAREPRAFPEASTSPVLPTTIRDKMVEFYAFVFCQGGVR